MYQRILVPLDRSRFAEHALPYAASVGSATGGTLRIALVHTFATWAAAGELPLSGRVEVELRDAENEYLSRTARLIARDTGLHVESALLEGSVQRSLLNYAHDQRVDLIVLGSHGRGGLRRAWLGSVSDALLRHADMPLLVVRPDHEDGASETTSHGERAGPAAHGPAEPFVPSPPFTRLLVALDGSRTAETAFERALDLPLAVDAQVCVQRVIVPPIELASAYLPHTVRANNEVIEALTEQAQAYLADIRARFSDRVQLEALAERSFQPAEAILAQAEQMGADLIVVGTHGRGQLARTMLGSVADKVIRGADTAVFVFPAAALADG